MVEFHGWIHVLYESEIVDKIECLKKYVQLKELDDIVVIIDIKQGECSLHVNYLYKRYTEKSNMVIDFYKHCSIFFKNAYGLLYWRNDEDDSVSNEFKVLRLAKGELKEFKDSFLSPCDLTIE